MWSPRQRVHPQAPVVALDIDGTLGKYHEHFWWFAELYLQCPLELNFTSPMRGEFSEALGLEKSVYRDIKLAYRQGGLKRSLPVWGGVPRMVDTIRAEGYQVWICTTRPWLRLDNVDKDTAFWLEHNNIAYDGVLFGEEKYQDLVDIVGIDRVVCVVDDLPEVVQAARDQGIHAALRKGDHNQWAQQVAPQYFSHTIESIVDMHNFIKDSIKLYEQKEGIA